jgi:hypothetical protein
VSDTNEERPTCLETSVQSTSNKLSSFEEISHFSKTFALIAKRWEDRNELVDEKNSTGFFFFWI